MDSDIPYVADEHSIIGIIACALYIHTYILTVQYMCMYGVCMYVPKPYPHLAEHACHVRSSRSILHDITYTLPYITLPYLTVGNVWKSIGPRLCRIQGGGGRERRWGRGLLNPNPINHHIPATQVGPKYKKNLQNSPNQNQNQNQNFKKSEIT